MAAKKLAYEGQYDIALKIADYCSNLAPDRSAGILEAIAISLIERASNLECLDSIVAFMNDIANKINLKIKNASLPMDSYFHIEYISMQSALSVARALVGQLNDTRVLTNQIILSKLSLISKTHDLVPDRGGDKALLEAVVNDLANMGSLETLNRIVDTEVDYKLKLIALLAIVKTCTLTQSHNILLAKETAIRMSEYVDNIDRSEWSFHDDDDDDVHINLATAFTLSDEFTHVYSTLEQIHSTENKRIAFGKISYTLFEIGKLELAHSCAITALDLCKNISDYEWRSFLVVAKSLGSTGNVEGLKRLSDYASKINNEYLSRDWIFKGISKSFVLLGKVQLAKNTAYRIEDELVRTLAMSYIARYFVKIGDDSKALEFLADHSIHKACAAHVLLEIAKNKKKLGNYQAANDYIQKAYEYAKTGISNPTTMWYNDKDDVISLGVVECVQILLEMQDFTYSLTFLGLQKEYEKISMGESKSYDILGDICHALAVNDQKSRALDLWITELTNINLNTTFSPLAKLGNFRNLVLKCSPYLTTLDKGETLVNIYQQLIRANNWWNND